MALDRIDADRDRGVVLVLFRALAASREGLWGISVRVVHLLSPPARNRGMNGSKICVTVSEKNRGIVGGKVGSVLL